MEDKIKEGKETETKGGEKRKGGKVEEDKEKESHYLPDCVKVSVQQ